MASGMIFGTGRLSLRTSISSPASTRRSTSAVWLRRSRAGMALSTSFTGRLGSHDVTEPRRVLIDWDYGAHGIWWVLTRQEKEAPAPAGRWGGEARAEQQKRMRPWSDRLTSELLDDLQEWNDAWDSNGAGSCVFQQLSRDPPIRVQVDFGTPGW